MGTQRNLDDSVKISEDEVALYDRQIRLWGMEFQKRIKQAKILVVGLNGVAAEVVKNLTLMGVKQITILDDTEVKPTDLTAQFFLTEDKIGKPRAESSASAIRELNPNVRIEITSGNILCKPKTFYKNFHALVATDCSLDLLIKLDLTCIDYGVQFYCTDTWGFFGYCFLNLQKHVFTHTFPACDKETGAKKEKTEKTVEWVRNYCPLRPTLLIKVGQGLKPQVSKVFVLLQVVYWFHAIFKRYPHPESREADLEQLKKWRGKICEKLAYDASKISDEVLGSLFGQLSPVCAVVGGVLANEIIKGITRNGLPVYNYFLFDGIESVGVNETIPEKEFLLEHYINVHSRWIH